MTRIQNPSHSANLEPVIDKQFIEKLIHRSEPQEDHEDLRLFLTNVLLFVKRVDGVDLTDEEKEYPSHSQFSHLTFRKGQSTAEGLKYRLDLIDRYNITNAQRIINIIASTAVSTPKEKLNSRQIRIIEELHKNPTIARYELAKKLSTTAQIIRKELMHLRQQFSLAVIYNLDYSKLRLGLFEIDFRTKSLDASEQLERFYRRTPPIFLRRINFDHNYRDGFFHYLVPDQPAGHRMFAERLKWLDSNFLEESSTFKIESLRIDISFENYNLVTGTWMLDSDSYSVGVLEFLTAQDRDRLPAREMIFGRPIRFDRTDYIIASTPYIFGEKQHIGVCQKVLEQHGYSLSKKTIWNRVKKLQQEDVMYPSVWYDSPELEELVKFSITCTPAAFEPIYRLLSILPYVYSVRTDIGLTFTFHRPSRCAPITGLLADTFDRIDSVSDIKIFRYEPTFSPQLFTKTADRWDESRQRWLLKKGDI
ncbi:MAG: hypothetical protein ACFFCH_00730 [Promethearchaeota archaeon]